MVCIAFFVCLVLFVRRQRQGVTVAVPLAVMALAAVRTVLVLLTVVHLIGTFKSVGSVPAAQKQAVLSAGIDEAMSYAQLGLAFELPLLIAAIFVDRALRRRQQPQLPRPRDAPPGARCAAHPDARAVLICPRCGGFMCAACEAAGGNRCASCSTRAAPPT
jgi:hypothetical protein